MLIFHDFSMTFQAWQMVFLNSTTFHDFPGTVVTLKMLTEIQMVWSQQTCPGMEFPENTQRESTAWDKLGQVTELVNVLGQKVNKPGPTIHTHAQPSSISPTLNSHFLRTIRRPLHRHRTHSVIKFIILYKSSILYNTKTFQLNYYRELFH